MFLLFFLLCIDCTDSLNWRPVWYTSSVRNSKSSTQNLSGPPVSHQTSFTSSENSLYWSWQVGQRREQFTFKLLPPYSDKPVNHLFIDWFFWDKILLCSLDWSWTHCVTSAGLELLAILLPRMPGVYHASSYPVCYFCSISFDDCFRI